MPGVKRYERAPDGGGIKRESAGRATVPPDVERRVFNEPCFLCGARGECRHRAA